YMILFFLLPNVASSFLPDTLHQNMLSWLYFASTAFLFLRPASVSITKKDYRTFGRHLTIGIVGATAIGFYPYMYFYLDNAPEENHTTEIFLKHIEFQPGTEIPVEAVPSDKDSAKLILRVAIVNNSR